MSKISTYTVNFYSIYTNTLIQEEFQKHIKKERCEEILEFLLKSNEIRIKGTWTKEIKNELVENFIMDGSKKELNLSSEIKSYVLDEYSKSDISFEDLFSELIKNLEKETIADIFPRFIRADNFTKIVPDLIEDKECMKISKEYEFDFSEEDFSKPYITKKDCNFFNYLAEDSFLNWDYIKVKDKTVNAYVSKKDFLPNVALFKNSWISKLQFVINYSIKDILMCLFNKESNFSKMNIGKNKIFVLKNYTQEELEKLNDDELMNQYGSVQIMANCKFPFPLNTRTLTFTKTLIYDEKNEKLYHFTKFYNMEKELKIEYNKKMNFKYDNIDESTYFSPNIGCSIYSKLSNEKTNVLEIQFISPGGFLSSKKLVNSSQKKRGKVCKTNYDKIMKDQLNNPLNEEEMNNDYLGHISLTILKNYFL
jgi:hypothetical protein